MTTALSTFRIIQRRPHFATFNGSHNSMKSKVLMWLYHRNIEKGDPTGMSARELSNEIGCKFGSLETHLIFYVRPCRYLEREMCFNNTREVWHYTIAERGVHFVEDRLTLEARDRFLAEIMAYRKNKEKSCQT